MTRNGSWGCSQTHTGRMTVVVLTALFFSASIPAGLSPPRDDATYSFASGPDGKALHALDSVGGYFTENRGQVNSAVRYYSRGNPAVAFRDDGVMFVVTEADKGDHGDAWPEPTDRFTADETATTKSFAYMLRFEGAGKVVPVGINRLPFNSNFFIGNVPDRWRTDVPNYQGILYRDLYDGIDLAYHVEFGRVKYEFILHPGADPSSITTGYEGVDDVVMQGGGLVLQTGTGEIRDSAPIAYQGVDEVQCAFALREHRQVGFDCEPWDRSRELVIDPLVYSTYLGGGLTDEGWSIAIDAAGDAYVTGETRSTDFPVTPGAFDTTFQGESDAFVAKLDPTGSSLIYCTYLGGVHGDVGHAIAIDSAGDAYFTGDTYSADFPVTPGAFDTTFAGIFNVFVAELNPTGSSLIYSTYLGGNGGNGGWSIAIDAAGDA